MDSATASVRSEILRDLKPNQNLLAVSKLQPIEKIKRLSSHGQLHFGENYVQEALQKIETLIDHELQWHLIGPLQKNKVKLLKKQFAYIHSVDSVELAELISSKAVEINFLQKVFLQVNLSGEPTKAGFSEEILLTQWPKLRVLQGIETVGLMTMPPLENQPENNRIYFKKLKALADQVGLRELSMGTSHDYKIALEEGATWIRIGTVLFGDRESKVTRMESRTK